MSQPTATPIEKILDGKPFIVTTPGKNGGSRLTSSSWQDLKAHLESAYGSVQDQEDAREKLTFTEDNMIGEDGALEEVVLINKLSHRLEAGC